MLCSNKFFETFSYLPPLSENEIAKQVDYIVNNGFIPSLEFAEAEQAYAGTEITRLSQPGYYDNRYVAPPTCCSFRSGDPWKFQIAIQSFYQYLSMVSYCCYSAGICGQQWPLKRLGAGLPRSFRRWRIRS